MSTDLCGRSGGKIFLFYRILAQVELEAARRGPSSADGENVNVPAVNATLRRMQDNLRLQRTYAECPVRRQELEMKALASSYVVRINMLHTVREQNSWSGCLLGRGGWDWCKEGVNNDVGERTDIIEFCSHTTRPHVYPDQIVFSDSARTSPSGTLCTMSPLPTKSWSSGRQRSSRSWRIISSLLINMRRSGNRFAYWDDRTGMIHGGGC